MAKFKVKAGHTITVGQGEDKPQKVYRAGESVDLSAEDAQDIQHALEPTSEKKSRKQAPGSIMGAIEQDAARMRRKQVREMDKKASKGKGDVEGALDSIRMRPDNPASGVPAYGKVPQDVIDAFEADTDESGITDEQATDAGLDKGFGREGGGSPEGRGASGSTQDRGQGPVGEGKQGGGKDK